MMVPAGAALAEERLEVRPPRRRYRVKLHPDPLFDLGQDDPALLSAQDDRDLRGSCPAHQELGGLDEPPMVGGTAGSGTAVSRQNIQPGVRTAVCLQLVDRPDL